MQNSMFTKAYNYIKDILVYKPPRDPAPFVLEETEGNGNRAEPPKPMAGELATAALELDYLLEHARRIASFYQKTQKVLEQGPDKEAVKSLLDEVKALEKQQAELTPILLSYNTQAEPGKRAVSATLQENLKIIQELYGLPQNKDVVVRQFKIPGRRPVNAAIVFIDGLIDKQVINMAVLQPLMVLSEQKEPLTCDSLTESIILEYLPSNQAKTAGSFGEVADGINSGDTAIFIDGSEQAILVETKGYAHRGVDRPQIEQSVRGTQAAFSEAFRVNTGLIRTFMPTSDLVTEIVPVGNRVPLQSAVMYLKSVANPLLVAEVKRRLNGISTDYVPDLGILEQFIEDHPQIPFPQALSTERPDRVAAHIAEGRVAIVYNGTPFVHIVPVSFFTFFHSIEDFSLKIPMGNFMRVLRLVGAMLSIILPSLYLAINYFHQEALPTELALAIAGARERVPFPALVEILLMEFSFELIREAGLRVPGLLGSTIGIVGAIILGQAAVSANIVSPIMVVIIAITGLASFTIPDYRMAFSLRIIRFVFLALSATMGLVGLAFGLLLLTTVLCSMKSFGIPYMTPVSPKVIAGLDMVVRGPVFRQERRPDQINAQDGRRQPHISRKWTMEEPAGKEDNNGV